MPDDDGWTDEELRASVDVYAEMYRAEQEGRRVVKKHMYLELEDRFDRTWKAYERRMQNISHVVMTLGGQYVTGLKPLSHIGPQIEPILERLVKESGFLETATAVRAPTTRPVELDELDSAADRLQSEWRESGREVLPPNGFTRADEYISETSQRKRCAEVKAWVLHQANGVCESCGEDAPFLKPDGDRYLEVHHVIQLADDGPDKTTNAVAVCPNCHRALHLSGDKDRLVENLYRKVTRLEK